MYTIVRLDDVFHLKKPTCKMCSHYLVSQYQLYTRLNILFAEMNTSRSKLLVGELGLVDPTPSCIGSFATGQVVGGGATLLAHLHVPFVPQLLSPGLPSLAPPCIAITPSPPSTKSASEDMHHMQPRTNIKVVTLPYLTFGEVLLGFEALASSSSRHHGLAGSGASVQLLSRHGY
jgi:hypothetical protein